MDTLIVLSILVALALFYFFPKRVFGILLFWAVWIAVVLLVLFHETTPMSLNF